MPLFPSTSINLLRNRTVRYVDANGKSQNAVVRAVTGATLTLWIPSKDQIITTAPIATTADGVGWSYR